MGELSTHHNAAMEHAASAFIARQAGDDAAALEHSRQAFEAERAAAMLVLHLPDNEPTRSVLLRSAACLAFDAGNKQEALRMVALAMVGNPPQEIVAELTDVVDSIRRLA
jgi:hypothetical protein